MKSYTQQGLYRAVDIFNHPWEYPNLTRILGFRFLLQWGHIEKSYSMVPNRTEIIKQMTEMVQEHSTHNTLKSNSTVMELVDMLIDFYPQEGAELLAQLRECGGVANENGPKTNGPECTVYGDSQSVHNKTISETVRRAAKYIAKEYAPVFKDGEEGELERFKHSEGVRATWIQMYPQHKDIFVSVFDRMFVDNAHFDIGYTVDQVFFAVLNWIDKQEDILVRELAKSRMCEELIEMAGYCSSGMLSHVINAIQGVTDDMDPMLQIRISAKEQVKSVLYNHFNKAIQSCDDEEVIDGLSEGGEKFTNFVKKEMAENIDKWYSDYGDEFISYVMEVANDYVNIRMYE